jgi:hypothetical protein
MLSRELLYFKYLGFEIQLKPEQRKSIINLLRDEDAGYRDSSYGERLPNQASFTVGIYRGEDATNILTIIFRSYCA